MQKLVAEFSLIALLAACFLWQAAWAAGEKTVACTEMLQKTQMFGPADVFFNASAIRLNRPGKSSWFLCKAPTWQLMEFDDESKTYFFEPLAQMKGDFNFGVHFVGGVQVQDLPLTPVAGTFMVAGVKSDKYQFERGPKVLTGAPKKQKDHEKVRSGEYWVSSEWRPTREVVRVLEQTYSLPPTGRLPIQLQYRDSSYETRTFLSTASLKRVNAAVNIFDAPRGYRKVSSFEQVHTPISSSELSDILRPPEKAIKVKKAP